VKKPAPPGTAIQLSGRDDESRWILSVIAKRSYAFRISGECSLADAQSPLVIEPIYDEATGSVLESDTDIWPFKLFTDVVVKGHAYNYPGRPSFSIGVRVEKTSKLVQVSGDRRATVGSTGQILFGAPTTLDRLPLSYAFAYGGRDAITEAEYGNPIEDLKSYLPEQTADKTISDASPFVCPKNPAGRGYVIEKTAAAVEAALLPNLEHPGDLLTPERLIVGDTGRWPAQPVPTSLGWLDYGAFPRMAWLGVVPDYDRPIDARRMGELRLGYATADILEDKPTTEALSLHGTNGASLGLRLPYLKGGEEVELLNLNPSFDLVRFRLPVESPALWVDGRNGKVTPTTPVIHSVVIEPDLYKVTITWRGSAPALRPYGADEIAKMPFLAEW
jgi:hypothetical protein